ncbi:MAG: type IV toxin-antitoxin system AbiEi family antitoxin domain-containing protein [Trebonia sp.]
MNADSDVPWEVLVRVQAGVVTRAQAERAGFTERQIGYRLSSGRWQRIHRGVYATFTGVVPRQARLWAAVLWAGEDAILSHETALEAEELIGRPGRDIHVTVPRQRRPAQGQPMPGVIIHRSDLAYSWTKAPAKLPRTPVEEAVIDLAAAAPAFDDAYSWLSRAFTDWNVRAHELRAALDRRKRFPYRAWLQDAIDDAADGVHFRIELRYVRDVERAHGLPAGARQAQRTIRGQSHRKDSLYEPYGIAVELDGIAYHRGRRRQDQRRDNVNLAVDDIRTFRFDLVGVTVEACESAAMVASALRREGWTGTPRPCRKPGCAVRGGA